MVICDICGEKVSRRVKCLGVLICGTCRKSKSWDEILEILSKKKFGCPIINHKL